MYNIPCVIFAGGKSSRMLEDKSELAFGGFDTLLEYQYRRLESLFSEVYVSTKKEKLPFTCNIIRDSSDVFAPTIGFVSLFHTLPNERIFVISVDTPFVDAALIAKVIQDDGSSVDATIVKTAKGIHPLCGIYHRSLLEPFTKMLHEDNHKLGMLLKASTCKYVTCSDEKKLMNLNYPSEYKEALTLL